MGQSIKLKGVKLNTKPHKTEPKKNDKKLS